MKDFKMKKLENKVAVVYGDGTKGGAIAKAFAGEGAQVFLTGRTVTKLDSIVDQILSSGGVVDAVVLDALDEQAVEKHLAETIMKAGKIDISYNAIGIPQKGIQGTALTELSLEGFSFPLSIYPQSHFITAKASLPRMKVVR